MTTREIQILTYSFNADGRAVAEDMEDTHDLGDCDTIEAVEYAVDLIFESYRNLSATGEWYVSDYIETAPYYDDANVSVDVARLVGFSDVELLLISTQVSALLS